MSAQLSVSNDLGGSSRPRRQSRGWTALAVVEVLFATFAVLTDRLLPTLVLLVAAGLSLAVRREGPATLGLHGCAQPAHMVAFVAAATLGWTLIQIGLLLPVLNHVTGERQDLSGFEDVHGHIGMLLLFVALSWTLAAFAEELVYRGYLQTRVQDVVGNGTLGVVAAVALSSILFGLAHTEQGVIGVVATTADAVFFSLLRIRYSGSLWAPILAHGFNNTLGLTVFFFVGPVYGLW